MHAVEKILARTAGKEKVTTGEFVNCTVALAGINDLCLQTLRSLAEMGGKKVHGPEQAVMFLVHFALASTITQADNQKQFREFCCAQGIDLLMDINRGVCHQILADKGLVHPGMLVAVTDSHTATHDGVRGSNEKRFHRGVRGNGDAISIFCNPAGVDGRNDCP